VRPPDERQLADLFASVRQYLDWLERGKTIKRGPDQVIAISAVEVLALARKTRGLGYPTNSGFEGGNRCTRYEKDENGQLVPVPDISDPTGEAAIQTAPIMGNRDRMLACILMARNELAQAVKQMTDAVPPAEEQLVPGCRVCERLRNDDGSVHWEPIDRSERCWWHYRFWLAEGIDAPDELGRAKVIEGRKITTRMVDEALAKMRGKVGAVR
jgi:hypothetical protein